MSFLHEILGGDAVRTTYSIPIIIIIIIINLKVSILTVMLTVHTLSLLCGCGFVTRKQISCALLLHSVLH